MANLSRAVKKTLLSPDGGDSPGGTVIYNPGIVIDPAFYQTAEFVVAFENHAGQWDLPTVQNGIATLPASLRLKSIAIAHSSPSADDALKLTEKVHRERFAGQFVTTQHGYTAWGQEWDAYLQKVRGLTGR